MSRFQKSVMKSAALAGSLMLGFSLCGCGGESNFETSEPYTEAQGEELEAMEESPGEESN